MWKGAAALIAVVIAVVIGFNFIGTDRENKNGDIDSGTANNAGMESVKINMTIESPAFQNNQSIPSKFTCDGANVNPPLEISGVPENAKSLALIMDDPDAPRGVWTHWALANINPSVREIPENSVPADAVELKSSFAKPGYGGPCPPPSADGRPHRYFFKLYALDTPKINSASEIPAHAIAQAELIGLYSRQR